MGGPLFYFRLAQRSVKPAPRMEQGTDEQLHTHSRNETMHSRTQQCPGPLRASRSRAARRPGQAPPRPRCQAPGQGADPRARAPASMRSRALPALYGGAPPAEGTRARGRAGRSERNDGGVAGSTTDFVSAAARLPQHTDLLLEEAGAPPRTQVGRAQHPGLRPRLRARLRGPRPGGGARAGLETEPARQALRGQHGGARRARALPWWELLLLPTRRCSLRDGRPGDGRAGPGRGAERCHRLGADASPGPDLRLSSRGGHLPAAALQGLRGLQGVDAVAAEGAGARGRHLPQRPASPADPLPGARPHPARGPHP